MLKHITNGYEYLSIDTDNKRYTLERICPKEDYELVKDADFVSARRTLIRDDTYRQCWAMPKKSQTVAITDDCDEPAIFVPKRNTRNSRMKCRAIQFA